MPKPLRYAVVTGCNRGLGFAIASQLVREGFQIALVCRRLTDARSAARLLGDKTCHPIQLDLAEGAPAVRAAASQIAAWLGSSKLDLLVNNAGNSYGGWEEEAWEDSRSVNYRGPVMLTEALLPSLEAGASVLMVGSGLGDLSLLSPKFRRLLSRVQNIVELDSIADQPIELLGVDHSWVGPYGLSKALIHRATEIFACDARFRSKGILVNAVCPGWVSTDMGGETAPISPAEGAGHVLEKGLRPDASVTGTFVCFCYKNYDDEHMRLWEEKHGKEADGGGWADQLENDVRQKCATSGTKRGVKKTVRKGK